MEISAKLEDYLEGILILEQEKDKVRVKDLSELMNVKAPSANEALGNLKKKNLVMQMPYGSIELTAEGRKIAEEIYSKHTSLKSFFKDILDVDEIKAEEEACKVEHYLSKETVQKIFVFMKKYRGNKK